MSYTHYFVDDIMVFFNGSIREMKKLGEIFENFCMETCMKVNSIKSVIIMHGMNNPEVEHIRIYFLIQLPLLRMV